MGNLFSRHNDVLSEDQQIAAGNDRDPEAGAGAGAGTPSPPPRRSQDSGLELVLPPTTKMTTHQFFYIFILDGIGAMVLSGAINFAIAYAMYATKDPTAHPIRLFQLPNTLAGDAGVTIIIQCLVTWLIEYFLVARDLRRGAVAPAAFLPEPTRPLARWFLFLPSSPSSDYDYDAAAAATLSPFAHVLRAMLVAVASFAVLWGPSVGILTAVGTRSGGDWVFESTWAPQVFKLVLGGVLALLMTPCFAVFWLAREGWLVTGVARGGGEEGLGPELRPE